MPPWVADRPPPNDPYRHQTCSTERKGLEVANTVAFEDEVHVTYPGGPADGAGLTDVRVPVLRVCTCTSGNEGANQLPIGRVEMDLHGLAGEAVVHRGHGTEPGAAPEVYRTVLNP